MPSVGLISNLRAGILAKEFRYLHMLSHWVGIIVMLALVYNSINLIRKNIELLGTKIKFIGWVLSFIVVVVLSFELKQVYIILLANSNNEHTYISQFNKAGLTILWSLCSFIMIWLGFKHSYKPLRVIAIVLFAIALLKLFVFDIRNISPGGKIAAFIMLGILLLSISFMYQRLKKILIDDEKK